MCLPTFLPCKSPGGTCQFIRAESLGWKKASYVLPMHLSIRFNSLDCGAKSADASFRLKRWQACLQYASLFLCFFIAETGIVNIDGFWTDKGTVYINGWYGHHLYWWVLTGMDTIYIDGFWAGIDTVYTDGFWMEWAPSTSADDYFCLMPGQGSADIAHTCTGTFMAIMFHDWIKQ